MRIGYLCCLGLALATICVAPTRPLAQPSKDDPLKESERIGARSDEYSRVFDKALACLVKGDAACFRALLSSVTVTQETRGPGAVDLIIRDRFIPFFSDFDKLLDETDMMPSYDVVGNTGFAICRAFQSKSGERKNFVIFVNKEGERYVVGNLLLNTTSADLQAQKK